MHHQIVTFMKIKCHGKKAKLTFLKKYLSNLSFPIYRSHPRPLDERNEQMKQENYN